MVNGGRKTTAGGHGGKHLFEVAGHPVRYGSFGHEAQHHLGGVAVGKPPEWCGDLGIIFRSHTIIIGDDPRV